MSTDAIRRALAANDSAGARALGEVRVREAPQDFDAWLMLGLACLTLRDADAARVAFEGARAVVPGDARVHAGLAEAALRCGQAAAAEAHLVEAMRCRPRWADPALQLGAMRIEQQRFEEAAPALLRAALADPPAPQALGRLLACAHALRGRVPPQPPPPLLPDVLPSFSVVAHVVDAQRAARLRANLDSCFGAGAWEWVDAASDDGCASAWNRGIGRASGEMVLLCRDDLELQAPDAMVRLIDELGVSDIVAATGTTWLTGPGAYWSGAPHVQGWPLRRRTDGRLAATVFGLESPACRGAHALSGSMLAMRRDTAARLRFDADSFDAPHLAMLDLTWRGYCEGLRLAVRCDLGAIEDPDPGVDAHYTAQAGTFLRKHALTPPFPHRPTLGVGAVVADVSEALNLLGWLASWTVERWRIGWEAQQALFLHEPKIWGALTARAKAGISAADPDSA